MVFIFNRLFLDDHAETQGENSWFYGNSKLRFPQDSRYRGFSLSFSANSKKLEVFEATRGLKSKYRVSLIFNERRKFFERDFLKKLRFY